MTTRPAQFARRSGRDGSDVYMPNVRQDRHAQEQSTGSEDPLLTLSNKLFPYSGKTPDEAVTESAIGQFSDHQ